MSKEKRITVYLLGQEDRPFYKMEWIEPGTDRRRSKSTKTADPKEAERIRADKEYELNNGLHRERCRMPWPDFTKLYLDEQLAGHRKNTKGKAKTVLNSFGALVRPHTVGDVDERMLSGYAKQLRGNGKKQVTIAGHLAYLRAALRWAADQKIIHVAPKVSMPKIPKKVKIRTIDREGLDKLLAVAPDAEWKRLILLAWFTGMRRNEMMATTWDGADGSPYPDLVAKRIQIPAEFCKADADQFIPIHADLLAILKADEKTEGPVCDVGHLPAETSRTFTALAAKVGLNITLHDLRRSFGTRYASLVPAPVLQKLMRHADIKTTLTFYTDLDGTLDDAINKG